MFLKVYCGVAAEEVGHDEGGGDNHRDVGGPGGSGDSQMEVEDKQIVQGGI